MTDTGDSIRIRNFYSALHKRYGSQDWWPAETRLECAVGAILTQNTSWRNVEKAIAALRRIRCSLRKNSGRHPMSDSQS